MAKADTYRSSTLFASTSEGSDVALISYSFFHQAEGYRTFGSGSRAAPVWPENAEGVPHLYGIEVGNRR